MRVSNVALMLLFASATEAFVPVGVNKAHIRISTRPVVLKSSNRNNDNADDPRMFQNYKDPGIAPMPPPADPNGEEGIMFQEYKERAVAPIPPGDVNFQGYLDRKSGGMSPDGRMFQNYRVAKRGLGGVDQYGANMNMNPQSIPRSNQDRVRYQGSTDGRGNRNQMPPASDPNRSFQQYRETGRGGGAHQYPQNDSRNVPNQNRVRYQGSYDRNGAQIPPSNDPNRSFQQYRDTAPGIGGVDQYTANMNEQDRRSNLPPSTDRTRYRNPNDDNRGINGSVRQTPSNMSHRMDDRRDVRDNREVRTRRVDQYVPNNNDYRRNEGGSRQSPDRRSFDSYNDRSRDVNGLARSYPASYRGNQDSYRAPLPRLGSGDDYVPQQYRRNSLYQDRRDYQRRTRDIGDAARSVLSKSQYRYDDRRDFRDYSSPTRGVGGLDQYVPRQDRGEYNYRRNVRRKNYPAYNDPTQTIGGLAPLLPSINRRTNARDGNREYYERTRSVGYDQYDQYVPNRQRYRGETRQKGGFLSGLFSGNNRRRRDPDVYVPNDGRDFQDFKGSTSPRAREWQQGYERESYVEERGYYTMNAASQFTLALAISVAIFVSGFAMSNQMLTGLSTVGRNGPVIEMNGKLSKDVQKGKDKNTKAPSAVKKTDTKIAPQVSKAPEPPKPAPKPAEVQPPAPAPKPVEAKQAPPAPKSAETKPPAPAPAPAPPAAKAPEPAKPPSPAPPAAKAPEPAKPPTPAPPAAKAPEPVKPPTPAPPPAVKVPEMAKEEVKPAPAPQVAKAPEVA